MHFSSIDIFCHVIDNFGDAGVAYRFANELKIALPDLRIRVFIDDFKALQAIAPELILSEEFQKNDKIEYHDSNLMDCGFVEQAGTADVLVEAFACRIPEVVLEKASRRPTVIINLEYFSAEKWIEGYHLKESLLGRGELKKYFFMPGITKGSGGVIVNAYMEKFRRRLSDGRPEYFKNFLEKYGLELYDGKDALFGTIFTYNRGFDTLLTDIQSIEKDFYLFIFGNKSIDGMLRTLERKSVHINGSIVKYGNSQIISMPFLPQRQYDELLCACDFNIVRGEDSLIRAVLADKPFLWQAYIQDDKYQLVKVRAFLDEFGNYFDDKDAWLRFCDVMMQFNDMEKEEPYQKTMEQYSVFFDDLKKIEGATGKMSYFIKENNNLINNFIDFLVRL
jgi:uncharacterized repeat protein (TIGR03837 family)